MNKKNITIKWRAYFVLSGIIAFALILIVRLYFLQIVYGEHFSQRAERQSFIPSANIFDRGMIYFTSRAGNEIAAATLRNGYKIAINPSIIVNPESVYNNLSMELELDPDDFLNKVERKGSSYTELINRVDSDIAQRIFDKNLLGVVMTPEKWRFYPGQNLASHVTGFVSFRGNDLKGQYGLERQYEDVLNRDGDHIFNNFFIEIFSNIKKVVVEGSEMKGSIVTTIEPTVQTFLEEEMRDLQEKWSSKMVGGIIMNPQNGEIYAMGLYPTFDLNTFNLVDDGGIYQNHLVESVYEMGSVIKPITIAIGLDQNKITPQSTYEDKGSRTMDGYTFFNYDRKTHGTVDMQKVLNSSLNLGVSHIVDLVGNQTFADYMKKIFNDNTGIDLPNEQTALINNLNSRNNIEYATASFGQGIAMTPISITRALASLGNGGYLVQPHLVKKINYRTGFSKNVSPEKRERIFSEKTSEEISRMLINTVDNALAGGDVALENYSVAAKTGTAQIAKGAGSGYYDDRFLHSFFGYFPAYEPEFIVFLYIIEPKNIDYASQTLTGPFMNITKFLLNYYQVPPDRPAVVISE